MLLCSIGKGGGPYATVDCHDLCFIKRKEKNERKKDMDLKKTKKNNLQDISRATSITVHFLPSNNKW